MALRWYHRVQTSVLKPFEQRLGWLHRLTFLIKVAHYQYVSRKIDFYGQLAFSSNKPFIRKFLIDAVCGFSLLNQNVLFFCAILQNAKLLFNFVFIIPL